MSVELAPHYKGGLRLRNPVMAASGAIGYGTEYADLLDRDRLGAIVSPSITLRPRKGHPQPRVAEAPAGILSAIGVQNIGLRALVDEKAPMWATWSVPVLVSIAGVSPEEYGALAAGLDGMEGVAGLEVNLTPVLNEFPGSADAAYAAHVTRLVRQATTLPVLVKLSLDMGDVLQVAQAVEEAGADALTVTNAVAGMVIDIRRRRPALGGVLGGLSGPALKPLALRAVYQTAQRVSIPVVGCGGIGSAADALEFLMAGATAVQVGTAILADPQAPVRIIAGIDAFLQREGAAGIYEIIGAARH
ncbi:MAG: dihydroorotate dehydrogenase [Chloroflexi bacterium]|nr:dihydroorotate dehydrogenase [Chloroflexota bacterium]